MSPLVRDAFGLAVRAGWRFALLVLVTMVVTCGPGIALFGAMFGPPLALAGFAAVVLFPLSIVVHEFGHALPALAYLRSGGSSSGGGRIEAHGTWLSAEIRRPALPLRSDVLVTVSGPLSGAAVGLLEILIALICVDDVDARIALLLLPFTSHLLALGPLSKDGRALRCALALHRKESLS